ncbi:hypothetical protein I302_108319 [Kwoniella bestiolae CBS 10118]|uniref:Uncharacterized protein n=1 Tax=Kwoniella bestiolae CBS 10118 TaxID=1296100 RepID=A0A1B9FW08_9TREE|nr:hypothetical protein I302_07312 [Kwoniella bestiolae CBS 10118]OCF22962.1 hypothetical protein I302_07312 [Kwoniella bestiolae CBS 10118]
MDSSNVASGSAPSGSTIDFPPHPSANQYNPSPSRPSEDTISSLPNPNLALPQFTHRNNSVSSLMDAVMGSNAHNQSPQQTSPAHYLPTPTALKPNGGIARSGLGHGTNATGAGGGLGDWDILSDVTARMNGAGHGTGKPPGEEVNVKELQEKVDKRRSQLPHLESQLAALDAQIKATEERLKAAGLSGGPVSTAGSINK